MSNGWGYGRSLRCLNPKYVEVSALDGARYYRGVNYVRGNENQCGTEAKGFKPRTIGKDPDIWDPKKVKVQAPKSTQKILTNKLLPVVVLAIVLAFMIGKYVGQG